MVNIKLLITQGRTPITLINVEPLLFRVVALKMHNSGRMVRLRATVAYTIVYDYSKHFIANLLIVIQAFSFKSSRYLGI